MSQKRKLPFSQRDLVAVTRVLINAPRPGMTPDLPVKGMKVWSRDRKMRGEMTGGSRLCMLEGCRGLRLGVRWPDGKVTFPCTKGMSNYRSGMRID